MTIASAERRFTPIVVESRGKDGVNRIGGYAAVFKRTSKNLGGFVEELAPGVFNDSRARGWPDVMARYNHEDSALLGTTGGGTLRLKIDDTGLDYEVDLPAARADVAELVSRGDVRKSSFAFRTLEDTWTTNDQGYPLRTLISAALIDVAPVNSPAYIDTSAGKRDIQIAYRSLSTAKQCPLEDVERLADENELRKLFVVVGQSVGAKPKVFGPSAVAALLARREDPYITS
jgi:HK97 family phage prohead protease